jgi:hypothetical protein
MAESDSGMSLAEVNAKLDRLMAMLASGGGRSAPAEHSSGSLDDQISRAVAAATDRQEQASKHAAHEKRLADLEHRTERQPKEHRPITLAFWGSDD